MRQNPSPVNSGRTEPLTGVLLPASFGQLLAVFRPCFGRPSYHNFQAVVTGWIHCLGRRTVTAVALASGALDGRHVSVFHRFFGRAEWALDGLGKVIFVLALAWLPADQPLKVLLDDTLARKGGKGISLASMHHDPLRSSARKPFFSFGHVWVVLSLWVPLPLNERRGFALPLLFRLYVGRKRGGQADAPSRRTAGQRQQAAQRSHDCMATQRPTKLQLAKEMIGLLATWAGPRRLHVAADSAYAGRTVLEQRPANVEVVSRLRMDAALWTVPPQRQPGQKGRPRRRGTRLRTPQGMAAARQHWHAVQVCLYGQLVTTLVCRVTALWYVALRDQPVRIILVRDPTGRRRAEAFFCTDLTASAAFILESYAQRWTLEVAFRDTKQHLGFEDPQNQTAKAVERTAPMAFIVYDLVLLWSASRVAADAAPAWIDRPWYRRKTTASFLDLLTALRRQAWRQAVFDPPCNPRRPQKWRPPAWPEAVLATA